MSPPFGGMIAFVKESEGLMERGQLDRLKNDEGLFETKPTPLHTVPFPPFSVPTSAELCSCFLAGTEYPFP